MSRCYGCMKYGIIYVAFIFLILGMAVIGLAAYLLVDQESYLELAREDEYLLYGKWFLLVAGTLMFFAGILGCCGGMRQSPALLSLFFSIVLLISIAELAAGVYSYVHRDEFADYFRSLMTNSVQNLYGRDSYITRAWDLIQTKMECCGSVGYRDYNNNMLQKQKLQTGDAIIDMTLSAISPTSFSVPKSCCHDPSSPECESSKNIPLTAGIPVIGDLFSNSAIYKQGCAEKFLEWLGEKTSYIIGILIGIGSIQLICLLFTCILICAFRSRRSYKN